MVNMTLFQIQLLVAIRLDVNAAMHIVNPCGVIVQMEQLKHGTGGLTVATKLVCDRCGEECRMTADDFCNYGERKEGDN